MQTLNKHMMIDNEENQSQKQNYLKINSEKQHVLEHQLET